jgi:hypothetical protein
MMTIRRIPTDSIFTLDELRQVLGLPKGCLPREVRMGRLRVAKRAGKYWTFGSWVAEWLTSGEVRRRRASVEPTGEVNGQGSKTH